MSNPFSTITPIISGTTIPGETVTVMMPVTNEILTAVSDSLGNWSVSTTQPLSHGESGGVMISSMNAEGHESISLELPIRIDARLKEGVVCGETGVDGISTQGNQLSIINPDSGTGITIKITEQGKWVAIGMEDVPEQVNAPQIDQQQLSINNTNEDNALLPELSGRGQPGDQIQVTMPGTGEVLLSTIRADGQWTLRPKHPLPENTQGEVSIVAINQHGFVSKPQFVDVKVEQVEVPDTTLLNLKQQADIIEPVAEVEVENEKTDLSNSAENTQPQAMNEQQVSTEEQVADNSENKVLVDEYENDPVLNDDSQLGLLQESIDIDLLLDLLDEDDSQSDLVYLANPESLEIDLSKFLTGNDTDAESLAELLNFSFDGNDTTVHVTDIQGDVHKITVADIDLTAGSVLTDQEIIQQLLDDRQIHIG